MEADNVLIPLEQVREGLGISHVTLWRRMKAARIEPVMYGATSWKTRGRQKAIRLADVVALQKNHH